MVNQLPQGWKEEELGKHANIKRGNTITKKQVVHGDYPVVAGGKGAAYYHNEYNRQPPVITVSGSGASAGYVNYWEVPIFASDCSTIEEKDLNIKYIYYFLKSRQQELLDKQVGVAIPHVSPKDVSPLLIPYPIDKGEQDYIVKTLDAVAEIIRLRKETIQLAKDLIPTIFQEMFGDPERKICLADVATIKGGKRLPYGGQLQDETTVHPYIRVADMVNNTIKKDELKYISDVIYNKIQNYTISSRDVYISIAGTIGRVGLVPDNLEGANLTENAAKIVLNENKINKVFLVYELLTDVLQSQIKSLTVQAGVPKLAISRIESLKIYCPPLSEQEEFADKVEQINKYIAAQQEELEQFETLFQSLLQEAFTGVLTWNYPRKECHDKKDK
ncbi:MAG: restriction endonuclease subunit S [Alphaproteobacteria bacterium]|nr:restriction endonuclease subunit S [Alphaproteobacteria bacterium]MBP3515860.1 restriction endonuclease subunit S [Alphaproteobacteria bacterium]